MTNQKLLAYRKALWRLGTQPKLRTEPQAMAFLKRVGLCLLFDCEAIPLPKLAEAAHDDADWWAWKDTLQAKRQLYNGRVIAHKATLIDMDLLPCFLAIYFDQGGCEEYEEEEFYGRLSPEAVRILRWIDRHGPMAVDQLRLQLFPRSPQATRMFHQALHELQAKFKVAVAGLEDRSWGVRVIELFTRWVPAAVVDSARQLDPETARERLVCRMVTTAGALSATELIRLLGWERDQALSCVRRLLAKRWLCEKVFSKTTERVLTVL